MVTSGHVTKMWVTTFDRSSIAENFMLHANFKVLSFIAADLFSIKILHCGKREFRPFCSCDLDLDPMTFIYELDPYSLKT